MSEIRAFMGYLWLKQEEGFVTVGITEEGLAEFEEILSMDLPRENELVEEEQVIGTLETNEGSLDIYSPVNGKVVEINQSVVEDSAILREDPYEEGWLLKIEVDEDFDEDDDFDDEDDDDDELEEEED